MNKSNKRKKTKIKQKQKHQQTTNIKKTNKKYQKNIYIYY